MPKPVLAAVNGPAVGIGCSLALACDLVVAAGVGLLPARLREHRPRPRRRLVGARPRARRLRARGRDGDAGRAHPRPQALEWGLVNRVVPDDDFDAAIDALADAARRRPDARVRGDEAPAQRLAVRPHGRPARARSQPAAGMAAESADFREGVLAFLQKRPAAFSGA